MRTIVELYDKEPLENVLSACIFKPELVVYICDVRDNTLRKENAVYRLLRSRGLDSQVRFYYIDTTDLAAIRKTLVAVVRDYPGCVFDCSGGKDLVLLAAGVFCREKDVPAFYIDVDRGRFIDLNDCGALAPAFSLPAFCAEDVLALAGARLVGGGHFDMEHLDADFERDAMNVWTLVHKNPDAWGDQVGYFQAAGGGLKEEETAVHAPLSLRVNRQASARCNLTLLRRLERCGIVNGVCAGDGAVAFSYKSPLHKKCLQNHGIWLELYAYFTARRSGSFHDVRTSVVVDWDNAPAGEQGTRNEIDVLLVRGVTPVFISCKMGLPSPLALSEIRLLSEKFGGERTRTVLLTAADVYAGSRPLAQRAADLGITLIDRSGLAPQALTGALRRLVAGTPGGGEGGRAR